MLQKKKFITQYLKVIYTLMARKKIIFSEIQKCNIYIEDSIKEFHQINMKKIN